MKATKKQTATTRKTAREIAKDAAQAMHEAAQERNAKRNPDTPRRFIGTGLARRELFDVRLELTATEAAFIRATSHQRTTAAALASWIEAALDEAADRYFAARPKELAAILAETSDRNAARRDV